MLTGNQEKLIKENKIFMERMKKIEESYFQELLSELNLNEKGEDWLFDYLHNTQKDQYYDFSSYLEKYKIPHENIFKIS